jgi:hypothetical protein
MISICERLLNPVAFQRFYRGSNKPTPYGSQGRLRRSGSLAAESGVYKNQLMRQKEAKKKALQQYTNPMQTA